MTALWTALPAAVVFTSTVAGQTGGGINDRSTAPSPAAKSVSAQRVDKTDPPAPAALKEVPDPAKPDMQAMVRRALNKARDALLGNVTSATAWGDLGAVCYAHKLADCATTCYRRAATLDPKDFTFSYMLALSTEAAGRDADEVIGRYRKAVELKPDYAPARWRLGAAYQKLGRQAEALDAFLQSTEIDLRFPMGHRSAGQLYLAMGNLDLARKHLERAAFISGRDGAVWAALSQIYRRLGDAERAKKAAERSRKYEPVYDVPDPVRNKIRLKAVDSVTLYNRGKSNVSSGRFADAIPDLKICAEADPDDAPLQVFLATAYRATDQLDLAEAHAKKALQIRENMMAAYLELAAVSIKRNDVDAAMDYYRRAQEADPGNHKLHAWMGDALVKAGYNVEGIGAFEQAAAGGRLRSMEYWVWGVALSEIGDVDGAIEKYRLSLKRNPSSPNVYYSLGLMLEKDGQIDEAIANYRQATSINPSHVAAQRLKALGEDVP